MGLPEIFHFQGDRSTCAELVENHTSGKKLNKLHVRERGISRSAASVCASHSPRCLNVHWGISVPYFSHTTLTRWQASQSPSLVALLVRHLLGRAEMVLRMLELTETITKTACVFDMSMYERCIILMPNSEFARVFGVDFFSVINRGSQFKVESFMFRIAKPESFVLLSPSKEDVGLTFIVSSVRLPY